MVAINLGILRSIPARAGEPLSEARSRTTSPVYPRASGGTPSFPPTPTPALGLSPRERGNPGLRWAWELTWGSIPARAGEPSGSPRPTGSAGVYPRASGGTVGSGNSAPSINGLSPRERGNRLGRRNAPEPVGSIPARAGEPPLRLRPLGASPVYPRASGGTSPATSSAQSGRGLSPRERGNHCRLHDPVGVTRSIPARAGEPGVVVLRVADAKVYPRASGGTECPRGAQRPPQGLSPRERGNPLALRSTRPAIGSIPARAGEPQPKSCRSQEMRVYPRASGVYPRASGGTARISRRLSCEIGLSPRERGNRGARYLTGTDRRSIPARAGEPARDTRDRRRIAVYPRASGGTVCQCATWCRT